MIINLSIFCLIVIRQKIETMKHIEKHHIDKRLYLPAMSTGAKETTIVANCQQQTALLEETLTKATEILENIKPYFVDEKEAKEKKEKVHDITQNYEQKIDEFNELAGIMNGVNRQMSSYPTNIADCLRNFRKLSVGHPNEKKLTALCDYMLERTKTKTDDLVLLVRDIETHMKDFRFKYLYPYVIADRDANQSKDTVIKSDDGITLKLEYNHDRFCWVVNMAIDYSHRDLYKDRFELVRAEIANTSYSVMQYYFMNTAIVFNKDSLTYIPKSKHYYGLYLIINNIPGLPLVNELLLSGETYCPYITYKKAVQDMEEMMKYF